MKKSNGVIMFFAVVLFAVTLASCAQTEPARADRPSGTAKTRLNFHLVDEVALASFDDYLASHPDYTPEEQGDGTFRFPEELIRPGTVVLGAYRRSGTEDEFVKYFPIRKEPVLRGLAVKTASVDANGYSDFVGIFFTIGDYVEEDGLVRHGREILMRITEKNIGKIMAIVYDHKILSAAWIQSTITDGRVRLSGPFTLKEAESLAEALTADATGLPPAR